MLRTSIAFVIVLALAGIVSSRETPALHAQTPAGSGGQGRGGGQGPAGRTPSIEDRTSGLQKLDGYFPLYWEERTGLLSALELATSSWHRIVGLTLRARGGISPAAQALIAVLRKVGEEFRA